MLELWEILVPTIIDRGKGLRPVRTKCHREWDIRVRRITGGLTILPPAKGSWINPSNELFLERMIPVRIACTSSQIDDIIRLTLNYYYQEAVMAYKISEDVRIIHRK